MTHRFPSRLDATTVPLANNATTDADFRKRRSDKKWTRTYLLHGTWPARAGRMRRGGATRRSNDVTSRPPGTPPHRRKLGVFTATALVVGNMIGSGIFLLPAALAAYGGVSIFGWLATTTGAAMLALVFARLSRIMPRAGGPYAYSREGMGEFPAFLVAWGYWVSIWVTNAAIAVAMVSYLSIFWPALGANARLAAGVAVAAIWVLTWVNGIGVHYAGRVQLVTTLLKLAPLVAIAGVGLFYLEPEYFTPLNRSDQSLPSAINATAALTLWAFLGLESATIPAEEIKDPQRTVSQATLFGTLIAAAVYILGSTAVMGLIPPATLVASNAPFADAAALMWGPWAAYATAACAAVACFGALNGWILMQGQLPLAAARDGVFPTAFGRVSANGTPVLGIAISSALATILIFVNYQERLAKQFEFMILLATLTCLVPYVASAVSALIIILRPRARVSAASPVTGIVIACGASLYSLWAIVGLGSEAVLWGVVLLAIGVPFYVGVKRRRTNC